MNKRVLWFVTAPDPRHPGTGYDAGQRGWRLHAVDREQLAIEAKRIDGDRYQKGRRPKTRAMCGTRPAHGWGHDLYIEEMCTRCLGKLEPLGMCPTCHAEGDVLAVVQKEGAHEGVGEHKRIPCKVCGGAGYIELSK